MTVKLWDLVQQRAAEAHASGAMYRIESEAHLVRDAGVDFVVRVATDFAAQVARQPRSKPGNPFAEPEAELLVADVSPTHVAILNKYHVIESHLLVVTRNFVDQNVLLDVADFEALVRCFPDSPAIGFYNGGSGSGASQSHKHLQVVSLPLAPWADIPMAPRLGAVPVRLPFAHAFAREGVGDAAKMHEVYRHLLAEVGIQAKRGTEGEWQSGPRGALRGTAPYNLLVTREWMLLVPRSRDAFEKVSINSLAFAGALFVREPYQLEDVRRVGPMGVLGSVCLNPAG
jgi:ATP adenylyltransferase